MWIISNLYPLIFGFVISMSNSMDNSGSLITYSNNAIDRHGIISKDSGNRDLLTLNFKEEKPFQHAEKGFLKKIQKDQVMFEILKNMFSKGRTLNIQNEQNGYFQLKISKSEIKDLSKLKQKLPKSGIKYVKQMRKEMNDISQNMRRKKLNNERYQLFIMRVH